MGRTRQQDGDSFDLLLDTICNMFGGMVLIAILLAIIAKASVSSDEEQDKDPKREVTAEISARQDAEAIHLAELITQSERRLASVTNVAINATREDVDGFRRELSALKTENMRVQEELQTHVTDAEEKRNTIAHISNEVERILTEVEQAMAKVERRNLRLPRLRTTDKAPVFLAVKNGHLCPISSVSTTRNSTQNRGYNLECVSVDHEPGGLAVIEVNADAGQLIEGMELPGRVGKQILDAVDRHREFLSFAVYPDSYGAFNRVKEFFSGQGYEFNWLPMVEDQTLSVIPAESISTQ